MTQSLSDLSNTAKQLATWLGTWRILLMIFGVLAVLGGLVGFALMGAASSQIREMGLNSGLLMLIPLLVILGFALSTWVNWMLLGWGKDWVEQATAATEQGGAAYGLAETRGNLDKWLSYIIWGTLVFMVLAFLLVMGTLSVAGAIIGDSAMGGMLGAGAFILLPIFAVIFLLSTYLPLTSLRRFLGDATARLQGASQAVIPAAKTVNTWTWVLIALQAASILFSILNLFGGDGRETIFSLIVTVISAGLYIITLLLVGRFAKFLAERLDAGTGHTAAPAAPSGAPLRDYSSMGRMADQLDEPRR